MLSSMEQCALAEAKNRQAVRPGYAGEQLAATAPITAITVVARSPQVLLVRLRLTILVEMELTLIYALFVCIPDLSHQATYRDCERPQSVKLPSADCLKCGARMRFSVVSPRREVDALCRLR